MASSKETVDFIVDQLSRAGEIVAKRMFGEYGIYVDGKMAAVVADDQLFVKPTAPGKAYLGTPDEAPPYPQAKPWYRIDGERWDDREWLGDLLRVTAQALPVPAPKKR
jgi:DNA transformation protein